RYPAYPASAFFYLSSVVFYCFGIFIQSPDETLSLSCIWLTIATSCFVISIGKSFGIKDSNEPERLTFIACRRTGCILRILWSVSLRRFWAVRLNFWL